MVSIVIKFGSFGDQVILGEGIESAIDGWKRGTTRFGELLCGLRFSSRCDEDRACVFIIEDGEQVLGCWLLTHTTSLRGIAGISRG